MRQIGVIGAGELGFGFIINSSHCFPSVSIPTAKFNSVIFDSEVSLKYHGPFSCSSIEAHWNSYLRCIG